MAIRAKNATLIEIEDGTTLYMADLFGESTDDKPSTGYANGTLFLEVDTGKLWAFCESDGLWTELGNNGGGGDIPK